MNIVIMEKSNIDLYLLRDEVKTALKQMGRTEIQVKGFTDYRRAEHYLENHSCDILFAEPQLIGKNGLAFAKEIQDANPNVSIIFITVYEDQILQAVRMHLRPVDYLLKPVPENVQGILQNILAG